MLSHRIAASAIVTDFAGMFLVMLFIIPTRRVCIHWVPSKTRLEINQKKSNQVLIRDFLERLPKLFGLERCISVNLKVQSELVPSNEWRNGWRNFNVSCFLQVANTSYTVH